MDKHDRCKNPQQNIIKQTFTDIKRIIKQNEVDLFQGCKDGLIFEDQSLCYSTLTK